MRTNPRNEEEEHEDIAALKKENTWMKQKLNGEPTLQETIEGERPQTRNRRHINPITEKVESSY